MLDDVFEDAAEVEADLAVLESVTGAQKAFVDEICAQSQNNSEKVLATLRQDATYLFAQFLYALRARGIRSDDQIGMVADLHNQYIVALVKDEAKMTRLGLHRDRLLESMFTADTLPRLVQHWREHPGAIDQSNLARFLVALMSSETCRKVIVACEAAGFIKRQKTPFGTTLVLSRGVLEQIFGNYLRNLRRRLASGD